MEREVLPQLPTSGQIFGALIKNLGISHVLPPIQDGPTFLLGTHGTPGEGIHPRGDH